MKATLKFYDTKEKNTFETNEYEVKEVKGSRGIRYLAKTPGVSGRMCTVFISVENYKQALSSGN